MHGWSAAIPRRGSRDRRVGRIGQRAQCARRHGRCPRGCRTRAGARSTV